MVGGPVLPPAAKVTVVLGNLRGSRVWTEKRLGEVKCSGKFKVVVPGQLN
jgi:hypothetical protein